MIYKGLNRIGMIGDIKTNGGGEVAEVYGGIGESDPIYYKQREMVGTSPMQFKALGLPLKDYLISGNTLQDGTPSPDMPVDVVGCGVRTENLWDEDYTGINEYAIYRPLFVGDGEFTLSTDFESYESSAYGRITDIFLLSGNASDGISSSTNGAYQGKNVTARSVDGYITIAYRANARTGSDSLPYCKTMLSAGSIALPYEPYGYKLPISSDGVNLVDDSKVTLNTYLELDGSTGVSSFSNLTDYIGINGKPFAICGIRNTSIMNSATRTVCFYNSNKTFIKGVRYPPDVMQNPAIFSDIPAGAKYIRFTFDKAFENSIMLNLGSTALPYEPYVEPIETNIYLGEAQTTRKIKKLVLTGEEDIAYQPQYSRFLFAVSDAYYTGSARTTPCYCSHYESIHDGRALEDVPNESIYVSTVVTRTAYNIKTTDFADVTDFKSYLAAQYAAGTPVTVWYVLAEPETGIVNEPLMKIVNYADTVSFAQAGVTIPTVPGSNVLDVPTEVPPSEIDLTGRIKTSG